MSVHKKYVLAMVLFVGLAVGITAWAVNAMYAPEGKTEGSTFFVETPPSYKMVFIPKNSGNPYFEPLFGGIKTACMQTESEVSMVAPESADADSQVKIIKDQIDRSVDVIFIAPNSADTIVPVLDEAIAKGITVITVDSDLTGHEKSRTASVLTVNPRDVGESQLELMGVLLGYKGKFAILSSTPDAPNQKSWIKAMNDALKANPKYKEMELVDTVYGNDNDEQSYTECKNLLAKHADLNGILSPTTVGITAAAKCVKDAGKAKQIQVTGLGSPKLMRPYIKDGTVEAFALWNPADEGFLAGVLAQKLASKDITAKPGANATAGHVSEHKFNDNNQVFSGSILTFTKYNIDQFDF